MPQSPQRGTAEGSIGEVRPHRHLDSANSARSKQGTLVCREYGLLAPKDPAGDPAAAEPQKRRDIP